MSLTPESAEKLKSANLRNLVQKLSSGKTLTAAELRMVEDARRGGEDKDLVTLTKIAELFGVSRKTIYQWRKDGLHEVPEKVEGKEDVAAWRRFFAANPSAGHYDGKPRRDRESLLCDKLQIEIDIANLKYKQQAGELMSVAEAKEAATRVYSVVRSEFMKLTSDLPPMLVGLDEAKIQATLKRSVWAVFEDLSSAHKDFLDHEQ